MKIKSPYRRPTRRTVNKGNDGPFFQKEGAESSFFNSSEKQSKTEEEEPAAKLKENEEEATKFKEEEEVKQAHKEEEEPSAKEEEEPAAKENEEEAITKEEEEPQAKRCCGGEEATSHKSDEETQKDSPSRKEKKAQENSCDKAQIQSAISGAKSLADKAVGRSTAINVFGGTNEALGTPPTDGERHHERWFGKHDAQRARYIADTYLKISQALSGTIHTECNHARKYRNVYAYVIPGGERRIFICKKFWQAPSSGINSRAGVILHEIAHEVDKSIVDKGYGVSKAQRLAKKKPHYAIHNADNFEYFAETI